MLSKKSIKIISVVLFVAMLLLTVGSTVFAVDVPKANDVTIDQNLSNTIGNVLGFIRWGGIVAAVVIAMFIGIKYITSAPEGKAEIKKTLGYYVAGIVILLSASTIVTVIQNNFKIG